LIPYDCVSLRCAQNPTQKTTRLPRNRYLFTVADPRGRTRRPPYFRKGNLKKNIYHLPIVNVDRKAESCFPGYLIIETTANGSDLFEAIAHQLVAGTYNVPTPSHIIGSVLISYVRENPAMTAEVTPEGLYNHNVCTMMWHYTARWMFGGTGTRISYRTSFRLFVYLSQSCAVLKRLKGSSCHFV